MPRKRSIPLIIIVQRIIPHYRFPFFKQLTISNPDLDIRIYHGGSLDTGDDQFGIVTKEYETYNFRFLGYLLVFQPRLALDVLRESPDVVILEGTFGIITNFAILLLRKIAGRPTLFWTAGWDNPGVVGIRLQLKSLFIRLCLAVSDGAIVYGSSASTYLQAHGFPKEKIVVAQNTIDIESILASRGERIPRGVAIREKLGWQEKKIVLYVGQISPIKRVDILVEAFRLLHERNKDVALLIIGDGGQCHELIHRVSDSKIKDIVFLGEVVENVDDYFATADLFVLPGTGGLALNQAMAAGLPVIATIADGTQKDLIIRGENGFLVPVDDVKSLEAAMTDILTSSSRLKAMGAASMKIIQEKATLQHMSDQYSMAIRHFLSF